MNHDGQVARLCLRGTFLDERITHSHAKRAGSAPASSHGRVHDRRDSYVERLCTDAEALWVMYGGSDGISKNSTGSSTRTPSLDTQEAEEEFVAVPQERTRLNAKARPFQTVLPFMPIKQVEESWQRWHANARNASNFPMEMFVQPIVSRAKCFSPERANP